jgi:hypothetical protein
MNKQEKQELMDLVEQDCRQVIKFLQANNLKVKNKVEMLFSDGEVDESTIEQQTFVNLWELQYEPSLVKVKFFIERLKEKHRDITGTLELLLDKIVERAWPVDPNKILDTSTICPHFKSIKIDRQGVDCKVILIGAICYCN